MKPFRTGRLARIWLQANATGPVTVLVMHGRSQSRREEFQVDDYDWSDIEEDE